MEKDEIRKKSTSLGKMEENICSKCKKVIQPGNLENRIDIIENKMNEIYHRFTLLENNLQQKFEYKPIPQKFRENDDFINQENWISKQKELYPNKIIAYTIENKKMKLLAQSSEDKTLLNKIDELVENKTISREDMIYFR